VNSAKSSLTFPVERLFLQCVKIAGEQNRHERNHRTQDQVPRRVLGQHVFVDDRPRIHENHFDIKQDEQHRHQMEFHREARRIVADGIRAALIGHVLGFVSPGELAEKDRDGEHARREADQHEHREILHQLRLFHAREFRNVAAN
jgi:hypothetical protein